MKRLTRSAADLGDSNIPRVFVERIVPKVVTTLYWREPTNNNETIEIWKAGDGKFLVVVGDFSDGEWGEQDVIFAQEFSDVYKAISYVTSNYSIIQNEEPIEQVANSKSRLKKMES